MNKKFVQNILKFASIISLKRNEYKIVAITGSAGKTSTKKAVTLVLKSKYKVLSFEEEGYNTEYGLPLVLLNKEKPKSKLGWLFLTLLSPFFALKKRDFDYCVLEMGADKPGDIQYFISFIRPNVSVVTNVYPVHIEEFRSEENIAKEKGKIYSTLRGGDFAIINTDDKYVSKMKTPEEAGKIFFGHNTEDIKVLKQEVEGSFSVNYFSVDNQEVRIKTKALGSHMLYVYGVALAVGVSQKMELKDIVRALESFSPVKGRLNIIEGLGGSLIIDDSYNANPESAKNALDVLRKVNGKRKIAMLGDMRELGIYEESGHREIGAYLVGKCDILVTVGSLTEKYVKEESIKFGFNKKNIYSFKSSVEAGDYFSKIVKSGDIVLVKGSQNDIRMEKLVKRIMLKPEEASKLLCRQGKEWEKK